MAGRFGPAGVHVAPARTGSRPGPARRWEHVGQVPAHQRVRRGGRRPAGEGQRGRPGRHRRVRLRVPPPRPRGPAGPARVPVGHRHGRAAPGGGHHRRRSGPVGGGDPARHPAVQVRRPHPRRRSRHPHQLGVGRGRPRRGLRPPGGGGALRDARLPAGPGVRPPPARRAHPRRDRRGAHEPRHLHLGRHGQRVVRDHDHAGQPGRGPRRPPPPPPPPRQTLHGESAAPRPTGRPRPAAPLAVGRRRRRRWWCRPTPTGRPWRSSAAPTWPTSPSGAP